MESAFSSYVGLHLPVASFYWPFVLRLLDFQRKVTVILDFSASVVECFVLKRVKFGKITQTNDHSDAASSAILHLGTRPDIKTVILLAISSLGQRKLSFPGYRFSELLGQNGKFKMADNSPNGKVF